jgi:hypothetical protein
LTPPEQADGLDDRSKFLKAHMLNGRIYILENWEVQSKIGLVAGNGILLGVNRDTLQIGTFELPIDSVAIFETNRTNVSGSVIAMSVITGASLAMTTFCIINPKACFGSCPTFYVDNEQGSSLHAEGFSASVAPSLEATDIDALYRAVPTGREFRLRMTNEALETHVVRQADILAVRRPGGERIFATSDGIFHQASRIIEPIGCTDSDGDCLDAIVTFDGHERASRTDSTYLGKKEFIDLKFPDVPEDKLGLVIASRQTLLSTYLFYQTLAYMGNSAGEWIAMLERGNELASNNAGNIGRLLGGIEVQMQDDDGEWICVGETRETGPLATDVRMIPLPDDLRSDIRNIRLRLTRGHWRLDYVALVVLGREVSPVRIHPSMVSHDLGEDAVARDKLHDSCQTLVTLPGDAYTLTYILPEDFQEYELFLESRGYYIEWIRDEWLPEENSALAAMMFINPDKALRFLAPQYKIIEAEMEELFWNSRYAH